MCVFAKFCLLTLSRTEEADGDSYRPFWCAGFPSRFICTCRGIVRFRERWEEDAVSETRVVVGSDDGEGWLFSRTRRRSDSSSSRVARRPVPCRGLRKMAELVRRVTDDHPFLFGPSFFLLFILRYEGPAINMSIPDFLRTALYLIFRYRFSIAMALATKRLLSLLFIYLALSLFIQRFLCS